MSACDRSDDHERLLQGYTELQDIYCVVTQVMKISFVCVVSEEQINYTLTECLKN